MKAIAICCLLAVVATPALAEEINAFRFAGPLVTVAGFDHQVIPPNTPTPIVWAGWELNGGDFWTPGQTSKLTVHRRCRFLKVEWGLEWDPYPKTIDLRVWIRQNGGGTARGQPNVFLPESTLPRTDVASGSIVRTRQGWYYEIMVEHDAPEPLRLGGHESWTMFTCYH